MNTTSTKSNSTDTNTLPGEREIHIRNEYPEIIASLKAIAKKLRSLNAMADIEDIETAAENLEWESGAAEAIINAQ